MTTQASRFVSRFVILAVFLLACASAPIAQTIHKDDLDYFVGMFVVEDSAGHQRIDCSQFGGWMLLKPDTCGVRTVSDYFCSPHLLWVYDWQALSEQAGKVKWQHLPRFRDSQITTYLYYIMQDYGGWERQRNVLTVWQPIGRDSLKYVCGQTGDFDTGIGHAGVKLVTLFPDGSLLLIVDQSGEGRGFYGFYRGTSPCHFERFHSYKWKSASDDDTVGESATFDFRSMSCGFSESYQVLITQAYMTYPEMGQEVIDSVTHQSMDLWRLAKEHFGIDSKE